MADGTTFTTYMGDGVLVVLPATIRGIRDALPTELRNEFTEAVEGAPASTLFEVLATWAQRTRPDLIASKEAEFQRLEDGDFSHIADPEEVAAVFGPGREGDAA
ncbi:hypothetical protein ACFVIM_16135 [Streptomyces sp. NPDC057638]|uniref:hypothetical protein n=1 Tax=Streptomyces sp. NPDC057638 TaxID=3346190 RepID=UPI003694F3D6